MECWLETWDGRRLRLPQVLEWTFRYGVGTPCDSFSLSCLWDGTEIESLRDAVGFAAAEGGRRRFTGVLDEAEAVWDENGARLFLHGRGMAALLLDNEAEGAGLSDRHSRGDPPGPCVPLWHPDGRRE